MSDPILFSLIAFITTVYGTAVSFIQERFGVYETLPANIKQLINAILNIVVPYVVVFVSGVWKPEFGNLEEVVTSVFLLLAPVLAWVVSQVAHSLDPSKK